MSTLDAYINNLCGMIAESDHRHDAQPSQYPVRLEIELSNWDSLSELIKFLQYVKRSAGGGHSFLIAADETPDAPYKMFGKQAAGAVCFIDGDGNDKIGRIWLNGEEIK